MQSVGQNFYKVAFESKDRFGPQQFPPGQNSNQGRPRSSQQGGGSGAQHSQSQQPQQSISQQHQHGRNSPQSSSAFNNHISQQSSSVAQHHQQQFKAHQQQSTQVQEDEDDDDITILQAREKYVAKTERATLIEEPQRVKTAYELEQEQLMSDLLADTYNDQRWPFKDVLAELRQEKAAQQLTSTRQAKMQHMIDDTRSTLIDKKDFVHQVLVKDRSASSVKWEGTGILGKLRFDQFSNNSKLKKMKSSASSSNSNNTATKATTTKSKQGPRIMIKDNKILFEELTANVASSSQGVVSPNIDKRQGDKVVNVKKAANELKDSGMQKQKRDKLDKREAEKKTPKRGARDEEASQLTQPKEKKVANPKPQATTSKPTETKPKPALKKDAK